MAQLSCGLAHAPQLPLGTLSQPWVEPHVLHGVPLPVYSSAEPNRWLVSWAVMMSSVPRPQPPQLLRRARVMRPPPA